MKPLRAMLANRDLALVQAAWAAASLGNWAFSILLALYAYNQGGTGAVAVTLVIRMLLSGLAAPYAAVLADRHSRRSILVWSVDLRAAALLGASAAAALGAPLGVVLVFATLFTIVSTAHRPAQAALMPQLARTPAELAAANVGWSAIENGGFLLGSLLAAVLVGLTELDVGFAACAAVFAAAAVAARGLPRDVRPPPLSPQANAIADLTEGVRTVRRHPEMRLLVAVFAVVALTQGVFDVLIVVAAIELLGLGEGGVGWLNAAWGTGGVLSGAAAFALLGRGRLATGLAAGLVLAGLSFAVVAAWPQAGVATFSLFAMGVGFSLAATALLTLTQRLAPNDVLARVFGVQETLEVVGLGLGAVVAAGLVGLLDVRAAILAASAILPLTALAIMRRAATWEAGASVPQRTFALVRGLSLFAPLPIATVENIALRLEERNYDDDETIMVQGEPGDAFFVIEEGHVRVAVDGVPRRRLGPGEFFGEIALIREIPRTATVTTVGPVRALVIEREQFLASVGTHPRSVIAAEAIAEDRLAADLTPVPR